MNKEDICILSTVEHIFIDPTIIPPLSSDFYCGTKYITPLYQIVRVSFQDRVCPKWITIIHAVAEQTPVTHWINQSGSFSILDHLIKRAKQIPTTELESCLQYFVDRVSLDGSDFYPKLSHLVPFECVRRKLFQIHVYRNKFKPVVMSHTCLLLDLVNIVEAFSMISNKCN